MRALAVAAAITAGGAAGAETLALYATSPKECGTYAEGTLSPDTFFPGGEGGSLALVDPRPVPGLDATLYEGAAVNEGAPVRIGTVLVVREHDEDGARVVRVFTASEAMQERTVCPAG